MVRDEKCDDNGQEMGTIMLGVRHSKIFINFREKSSRNNAYRKLLGGACRCRKT